MAGVRNILIPLWRPINFHTSSIRDARLVDLALETLGNEAPRAPLRSARGFLAARAHENSKPFCALGTSLRP